MILKTGKFMLANQTSKIARTAELKIAIEQIYIAIMNLRMWNIKFDENLKVKNKLKNLILRTTEIFYFT